jgi:endo-1,4-beta-xylanase
MKLNIMRKLFCIAFITAALPGFSQTNLIVNGGFESGTTGWSLWGGQWTITSDCHSGSSAVLVSNRTASYHAAAKDITDLVSSGKDFTVSAWIKVTSSTKNLRATLAVNADGTTKYLSLFWTLNPAVGSFVQYSETYNLSWTNLVSINLYFETDADGSGEFTDYILDDVSLTSSDPVEADTTVTSGLKDIKSTMRVGWCATEGKKNYFTNARAKAITLSHINSANVQCYPAWGRWDETHKHVYHLDAFHNQVKELYGKNIFTTAHMLLGWDKYFPGWYLNGSFPADTVEAIMNSWIKAIITYKGNDTLVGAWNVVNEAISWDGKGGYWPTDGIENACEMQRMGFEPDASGLPADMIVNSEHPVYIRKAFEEARKYTNNKLELRDASYEFPTDQKYKAFYQLVVHLLKSGTPLDAVGFQTHIDIGRKYDWEGYAENIKRYRNLGLEVYIDEVDIGDAMKSWNEEKALLQKMVYYNLVSAAIKGGANLFETWGFIDENNPGWRPGEYGLLFDTALEPKPSFLGIQEALTDMSHILFWEMDGSDSTVMPDVMAYKNHGHMKNFDTPEFLTGFKNLALEFDGLDDCIETGILSEKTDSVFTCSFFFRTEDEGIIASLINADSLQDHLVLGINADGFLFAADSGEILVSDETIKVTDNQWHFAAIQYKYDTLRLFVDASAPAATLPEFPIHAYNQLKIGCAPSDTLYFKGMIDEVKLYNSPVEEGTFSRNMLPAAPANLQVRSYKDYIYAAWDDQSINEEGFIVLKKTDESDWITVDTLEAGKKSLKDYQFEGGTTYTYRVVAYNRFGETVCIADKEVTTTSPVGIAVNENDFDPAVIFPNPARDYFILECEKEGELAVLSANGTVILRKRIGSGENYIDISALSCGLYLVKVTHAAYGSYHKLMISR